MYTIHMKAELTRKNNYIFLKKSFKKLVLKILVFIFIMSMKYMYLYVSKLQVHLYNI